MKFVEYQNNAPLHIAEYLREGIDSIDDLLGEGYAKAHPELLGAFIQACAADVHANVLQDDVGGPLDALADPLRQIANNIVHLGM